MVEAGSRQMLGRLAGRGRTGRLVISRRVRSRRVEGMRLVAAESPDDDGYEDGKCIAFPVVCSGSIAGALLNTLSSWLDIAHMSGGDDCGPWKKESEDVLRKFPRRRNFRDGHSKRRTFDAIFPEIRCASSENASRVVTRAASRTKPI